MANPAAAFLDSLINLVSQESVKEAVRETARIYYTGDDVTINLIPAIILGLLALIGLAVVLGIPILSTLGLGGDEGGDGGYGAPTGGYADPGTGYGRTYASRSGEAYQDTVADLQAQISQLQESKLNLRNQLYYNPESSNAAVISNQIGHSS
jgi:Mg2+/citrate symporter